MNANVTVLALTLTLAPLLAAAPTPEPAGPAAVRALVLAAAEALSLAPVPSASTFVGRRGDPALDELERLLRARSKVIRRLEGAASAPTLPSAEDLARLRRLLDRVHELGCRARIHEAASADDLNFSAGLAVAEGYLDCARAIAAADAEGR
jgi:hypothetical protein